MAQSDGMRILAAAHAAGIRPRALWYVLRETCGQADPFRIPPEQIEAAITAVRSERWRAWQDAQGDILDSLPGEPPA